MKCSMPSPIPSVH